jgi:transaldolase
MTKLQELAVLGQSPWLDYIRKDLLQSGELGKLVDSGIRGVTSNPTIFENAIGKSDLYLDDIKHLAHQGSDKYQIYEELAVDDIKRAADVLRSVYVQSDETDGFVSLEVPPELCHDYEQTVAEARRLWTKIERPNLMIKVPATPAGVRAITDLIAEGISVNATLMFTRQDYLDVAEAYLLGLEMRHKNKLPLDTVASVASIFVSRLDSAVEALVEGDAKNELMGKVAVANSRQIYREYVNLFYSDRFNRLKQAGAHPQRPLFASTGTKNPQLPDVLYVDQLIGPDTVNTMPPATMQAFLDHGSPLRTVDQFASEDDQVLRRCSQHGLDVEQIGAELKTKGLQQFIDSFTSLLDTVEQKRVAALSQ